MRKEQEQEQIGMFAQKNGLPIAAPRGGPCTIASAGAEMIKIIAFTHNPPPTVESGRFQEVLCEWGHTWMWESLKLSGEDGNDTGTWLSTAIRNNTLVAVTDGSYMKNEGTLP